MSVCTLKRLYECMYVLAITFWYSEKNLKLSWFEIWFINTGQYSYIIQNIIIQKIMAWILGLRLQVKDYYLKFILKKSAVIWTNFRGLPKKMYFFISLVRFILHYYFLVYFYEIDNIVRSRIHEMGNFLDSFHGMSKY